jgi:hypothetical protein
VERETDGSCITHVETRNADKILVGKPEVKIQLWRSRHRWEDNIKANFKETRCEKVNLIHLAENRVQR